ncbi:MAG TPA: hypothetical protein VGZ22_23100, partial [Isosphaeraceae bacterium]|nr:hypothetical protein [Isosphaeraceae bacterium]
MHEPGPRPFTVLDAAVLTGASAIGLALISYNDESWWLSLNALVMIARLGEFHWFDLSLLANVLLGLTPLLAAWTVALLGLRLLPPRPLEIELFRQPGMVACHAATWTILVATLFVVFAARRNGTSPLADLTRLLPPS